MTAELRTFLEVIGIALAVMLGYGLVSVSLSAWFLFVNEAHRAGV